MNDYLDFSNKPTTPFRDRTEEEQAQVDAFVAAGKVKRIKNGEWDASEPQRVAATLSKTALDAYDIIQAHEWISIKALSNKMGRKPNTISQAIGRLIKAEMIDRVENKEGVFYNAKAPKTT